MNPFKLEPTPEMVQEAYKVLAENHRKEFDAILCDVMYAPVAYTLVSWYDETESRHRHVDVFRRLTGVEQWVACRMIDSAIDEVRMERLLRQQNMLTNLGI